MPHPRSDHFDGKLFFNPEPTLRNLNGKRISFFAILRARMQRDPAVWSTWPKHVPNTPYPALEAPCITFIGHSTFLLRLPGLNVLTDPVFSERCSPFRFAGPKRVRAPGLALENLPRIDLILLSHNHYDHMDLAALRQLRRRNPQAALVTTLGNKDFLGQHKLAGATELDWWQSTQAGAARITCTPARHFAARWLNDRNKTLWGGFWLEAAGRKIYFAGDTGYTKFFADIHARLGPPDLALLPIGAYEPRGFMGPVHMNPADAVRAFADLGASRAIGMHFGTFQLTAEAIGAPLSDLAAARLDANLPAEKFFALDVGESTEI